MHCFKYKISDDYIRTLNREQYKKVQRWLRTTRNEVERAIDFDEILKTVSDSMLGL